MPVSQRLSPITYCSGASFTVSLSCSLSPSSVTSSLSCSVCIRLSPIQQRHILQQRQRHSVTSSLDQPVVPAPQYPHPALSRSTTPPGLSASQLRQRPSVSVWLSLPSRSVVPRAHYPHPALFHSAASTALFASQFRQRPECLHPALFHLAVSTFCCSGSGTVSPALSTSQRQQCQRFSDRMQLFPITFYSSASGTVSAISHLGAEARSVVAPAAQCQLSSSSTFCCSASGTVLASCSLPPNSTTSQPVVPVPQYPHPALSRSTTPPGLPASQLRQRPSVSVWLSPIKVFSARSTLSAFSSHPPAASTALFASQFRQRPSVCIRLSPIQQSPRSVVAAAAHCPQLSRPASASSANAAKGLQQKVPCQHPALSRRITPQVLSASQLCQRPSDRIQLSPITVCTAPAISHLAAARSVVALAAQCPYPALFRPTAPQALSVSQLCQRPSDFNLALSVAPAPQYQHLLSLI